MNRRFVLLGLGAVLAGCAEPGRPGGPSEQEVQIAALSRLIAALGPEVDRAEAARVARIAVVEPLRWAAEWDVTDGPLVHNIKVNNGTRPRGLCHDWADDLQARMQAEQFQTLDWHRAIANHDNLLIEHSTLIVSAPGRGMRDGIVLDPWRRGYGRLYFGLVAQDTRYDWVARQEVFAWKRARRAAREEQ
jgi:hypothetical protein